MSHTYSDRNLVESAIRQAKDILRHAKMTVGRAYEPKDRLQLILSHQAGIMQLEEQKRQARSQNAVFSAVFTVIGEPYLPCVEGVEKLGEASSAPSSRSVNTDSAIRSRFLSFESRHTIEAKCFGYVGPVTWRLHILE